MAAGAVAAFWTGFGWVAGAGAGLAVALVLLVAVGKVIQWTQGYQR